MKSVDTVMAAEEVRGPAMKIWELTAKDRQEPPFHFAGVPHSVVVIAPDEKAARQHAAASAPGMAPAGFMMREVRPEGAPKEGDAPFPRERMAVEERSPWLDEDLTTCVEADLTEARVVSLDYRQQV